MTGTFHPNPDQVLDWDLDALKWWLDRAQQWWELQRSKSNG